jgi:hypothetical protein
MKEVLNNPLMKAFLNTTFKKYLERENLNGIYINFDANGEICLTEYKTAPNKNDKL